MATHVSAFTIVFPDWYDDRAEFEHASKGFLPDVSVRLEDGAEYSLYFIDPVRLAQDLECETQSGRPFLAESGLVVIPTVRSEAIRTAVAGLWHQGFFRRLKPTG